MSASLKRFRRRYKRYSGLTSKINKNNALLFFISLIVLIETLLLLFLIPKTAPSKKALPHQKSEIKVLEKKVIPKQQALPKRIKGKIAIVIDDWGYNTNNLQLLNEIKSPLTLAILPFREYSRIVAELAYKNNFEVIVHMPMEPKDKFRVGLESKTLMANMGQDEINSILHKAFENIPYAKGINNHMGSRFTEDEKLMTTIFKELKKKDFYFLDSYVTSKSVCYRVSKKIGIKFARRSIFLDNYLVSKYIQSQMLKLARESDKKGYAIGIGHDRKETLKVLKETIPKLEQQGYVFVFVSDLVN